MAKNLLSNYMIKPKLVIFDWDNTLISSWNNLYSSMKHTMEILGVEPWSMEKMKQTMHKSSRDFFPEVFGEEWTRAREVFYQDYQSKNATATIEVLAGTVATLEALKVLGVKMAIVSNKNGKYLRNEIERLGWNDYFGCVLGAYDLDEDKPSSLPVLHVLKQLEVERGFHVWFIGDTIVDMQCAQNSGCWPVLFGDQIDGAPHPRDEGIEHAHALDHGHLLELLEKVAV